MGCPNVQGTRDYAFQFQNKLLAFVPGMLIAFISPLEAAAFILAMHSAAIPVLIGFTSTPLALNASLTLASNCSLEICPIDAIFLL